MKNDQTVYSLALCGLFVALTAICSQIILPIGPVPVSLSLLPVLLCGALLSPWASAAAVGAYLVLGLTGAPVFGGFTGGPGALFGVTGGYLLGYLPCALLVSLFVRSGGKGTWTKAAGMAVGILVCYAVGTAWFMRLTGRGVGESLALCVLPFIPFDIGKAALAILMSRRLERPMKRFGG